MLEDFDFHVLADAAEFRLLGHANPYSFYPNSVVPVGLLNGRLAILFINSAEHNRREWLPLDSENNGCVMHDDNVSRQLADFDVRKDQLFARSATEVLRYPEAEEREFFRRQLADPALVFRTAFHRHVYAKLTEDMGMLLPVIKSCCEEAADVPSFIRTWLSQEIADLKQAGCQISELEVMLQQY